MHTALRYGKTGLTWSVLVSVIAWSIGLAALLTPIAAVISAESGDLIKASQAAVYYYGADGKRYVFPNQKTYNTWYPDFSGVITITDEELAAIPIGGNVTYKPGVKMVKITTDPKVYAVSKDGTLKWVTTEAVAEALYGTDWNQQIDDVPDAFFAGNYNTDGADIAAASEFDKAAEEAAATSINDDKDITEGGETGGGDLVVSLAADTPASGLAVGSAARLPFTKVNFTNNTNLDAVVDQVVVERMGLAQDASFSSVEILDAATMLPLNKNTRSLGAEHTANFNDDFTVSAQSTLGVLLAGNMVARATIASYAGEQAILGINSVTLKGGGTVSGTLPVGGNPFTINGTLTIGTATITNGANNPAAATKEVGTQDYIVTSFKITAGSAEDITVQSVTFTNNGSASPGDVENVELIDANTSTVVCEFVAPTADEISCALDHGIDKGKNNTYDLRIDIKDGSARTISYDIDDQADLRVTGDVYGYDILPSYTNSASPYFDANNTTIGDGTLQVESVSVTPTNVAEGLDQITLGKFKFVAKGEAMIIESIGWDFQVTTGTGSGDLTDLTNITVYDPDGEVVAGPTDPSGSGHATSCGTGACGETATTSDTFTVPIGENIYTVKGDLSTDYAANDTIQARVHAGEATVKGETSDNTITPTPSGATSGTTLTIRAASLEVKNDTVPAAQTVVAGAQDYEVANVILDATQSGDDIRVTSIALKHVHTSNSFPNMLSGWEILDGTTEVPVDSESITCDGATCNTAASKATTTFTITAGNLTATKGTSKTLKVKTNVGTGATSGTFTVGCQGCISGIDSEAQTATISHTNGAGQTMTLASGGTLNVAVLTDPDSDVVVGGSTVEVGRFTLQPKYEGVNFNFFGLQIAAPDGGVVGNQDELSSLLIEQVGGSSWSVPITGNRATVTPTGLLQNINQEKTYVVKATFNAISDASPASAGAGIRVLLSNIDVTGQSAGSSSVTVSGIGDQFNTFTVYKSIPTVAKVSFTGANTITGNDIVNIFKLSISADSAGPIGLWKLTFGITTTTVNLTTSTGMYLYESANSTTLGNIIAKGADILTESDDVIANGAHNVKVYLDVGDNNDHTPAYEHRVILAGATKYYTLRGTVSGHDGTVDNESISTVLAGDSAFATTAATSTAGIDRRMCSMRAGCAVDAADGIGGDQQDDFIWSDLNLDLYSTSQATKTVGMWFNGYRVPGLDNNSTTPQVVTD